MNNTYTENFFVRPTDCDILRRLRMDALFLAMQEGGERHAVKLGAGYDALMNRGLFFVLLRIHVRVLRPPKCGETLVHTTWPGNVNRFFFPRYHTFVAEDGAPVAQAGGLWVLLDTENRKIVSPAKVDLGFPDNSAIPAPVELPLRLPAPCAGDVTSSRTPLYCDFDMNGHVNNTRYIAWLCDSLGLSTMRGHYISDLTAGYEKEICSENPLTLALARDGEAFSFRVCSTAGEKHFVAGGTLMAE